VVIQDLQKQILVTFRHLKLISYDLIIYTMGLCLTFVGHFYNWMEMNGK